MYKLLDAKKNQIFWNEIPLLEDLYYHLDLWLRKYNSLRKNADVALIYVGVEDGRPFPRKIDVLVHNKIRELQDQK